MHAAQGDCLKIKVTDIVYTNSVQQMFPAKETSAHHYV